MRMFWLVVMVIAGCTAGTKATTKPTAAPAAPAAPAPRSEPGGMPEGYVEVRVVRVAPIAGGGELLLVHEPSARALPIYIGGTEASSIDLRLRDETPARPLTHDLFDDVLHRMSGAIVKAQVDELRDGIFIGSLYIQRASHVFKVDARPSDAIALAVGNHVPIYVAAKVLDDAGVPYKADPDADDPTAAARSGGLP